MSLPNSKLQAPRADQSSNVRPAQAADTVKLIYKPAARRVAHQVLVDKNRSRSQPEKGRFGCFEVERLFSQVWDIYCKLMPNESRPAANGSRMNMRMTCLTIACFKVLSDAGIEHSYATELASDISWKTYDKWRLFSGMYPVARPEPAPQDSSVRPLPLPVPYRFPGGYRQVDPQQRDRISHRSGLTRRELSGGQAANGRILSPG